MCFFIQSITLANQFKKTKWKYIVDKDCIDYLQFESDTKVLLYDCEIDLVNECNYSVHKDTLFITENVITEKNVHELWKYIFILVENKLYPIDIKQFVNGKLYSNYNKFDKNYYYKKEKRV